MATFQYLDEGNSEAQDRLATSFLLAQTSPGLARTGVLSGLAVSQTTTASGSVLVAAGAAPVQASVGTGVALLVNDTTRTLDVFTTNPMGGLPRNDIVAFDSVTKAIIAIIGTPNATPDDPTVPATACPLARLRHAASATTIPTAKIDWVFARTIMHGGSVGGAASGNLSGTSTLTVAHGLGRTPTTVLLTKVWTASGPFRQSSGYVQNVDPVTFEAAFVDSAGAFIAGEAAGFYWSVS